MYKKQHTVLTIAVVVVSLAAAGCVTNVAMQDSFWSETGRTVGVAVVAFPQPAVLRAGSQGALDVVINAAATADLAQKLSTFDPSAFTAIREEVAGVLRERGMRPVIIEELIDVEALPKAEQGGGRSGRDYSELGRRYDVDHLVLLSIQAVGATRKYYGFIAVGPHYGYCVGSGELIDLATSEVTWRYTMGYNASRVKVDGQWRNPPDYPEMLAATAQAIDQAVADVTENLR